MQQDYRKEVKKVLDTCTEPQEIIDIMERIQTSRKINRRSNDGKQQEKDLLNLCNTRYSEIVNDGAEPF